MPQSEQAFANLHVMKRVSLLVPNAKYRREQAVDLKSKSGNFSLISSSFSFDEGLFSSVRI
eukprot:5293162-Ditylum_brightwellii.AAC.1